MQPEKHQAPIITLTTDFGLEDEYVGTLKGVILSTCQAVRIIDITHAITPQDIPAAAMTIAHSYGYFPAHTIHIIVVDPGVGSKRSIMVLKADDHLFIAPNNGILTPLLTESKFTEAYLVENSGLFLKEVSNTFHGRDIMAPVAGKIAAGMDISRVGPPVFLEQCCRVPLPNALKAGKTISGEVIHIDHFGNLQTSITGTDLTSLPTPRTIIITLSDHTINGLSRTYTDREQGAILALLNSRNHLEIAIAGGNAATILNCEIGTSVSLICK